MKTRTLLPFVMMIWALTRIVFANAENQLLLTQDKLVCGPAEVVAETACLDLPEVEIQCRKQTLQLVNSSKRISKKLPHDGNSIEQPSVVKDGPVLDAFVTSWACLKSETGTPYILLLYTCNWGRDCIGHDREWIRIFSVEGNHLTVNFPKRGQSKRYEKLYQRLGISKLMKEGATVQGIRYYQRK